MASDLPTYTERLARISAILEPYLHLSQYVLATPEVNPTEAPNGLAGRWFDRQSGRPQVSVFIDQSTDIDGVLTGLRAEVTGEDYYEPGSSSEVAGLGDGEYAFLQHYADAVTAIVGNCRISVHPPAEYTDLAALVNPALEIGRKVGCSAYRNDFVTPPPPEAWTRLRWGVGPRSPGIPPSVPPGPRL
jgi:hypothetical protein